MIRALLPSVLLFLLPFGLYFLWLSVQRRRTGAPVASPAGGLLLFVDFEAAEPDGVYIPPRYEDGRLIPGHFAPRHEPIQ
jgi:hypothetical protein